jgi:hypothetical protein
LIATKAKEMIEEMICDHKSYGEVAWLTFQYKGRDRGLKAHPCCAKCGLVKNVSSDRPRPIGHYLNILGCLAKTHSVSRVQIRLISLELSCLEDLYGFDRHQQEKVFKEIILKYAKIPERMIENALSASN